MKKKVETVMVNNSTNINKTKSISHLKPLNIKKTMAYDIGNPGPGLGHSQK